LEKLQEVSIKRKIVKSISIELIRPHHRMDEYSAWMSSPTSCYMASGTCLAPTVSKTICWRSACEIRGHDTSQVPV